jgi:hypothetical protein
VASRWTTNGPLPRNQSDSLTRKKTMSFPPDAFIIGAQPGTTSLSALLDQHPKIVLSTPKEPDFFSVNDCCREVPGGVIAGVDTVGRALLLCRRSPGLGPGRFTSRTTVPG